MELTVCGARGSVATPGAATNPPTCTSTTSRACSSSRRSSADAEVTLCGPSAAGASLGSRIARYRSAPLTPVDVEETCGQSNFRHCPAAEWRIGSPRVRVEPVAHRGPTLGVRIGDAGRSLCDIPGHAPGLNGPLESREPERISGWSLARGADLLLHDDAVSVARRFGAAATAARSAA